MNATKHTKATKSAKTVHTTAARGKRGGGGARPVARAQPGSGARAQYTREYKRYLDTEYRTDAMSIRSAAARKAVAEVTTALRKGEERLGRLDPDTLTAIRAQVLENSEVLHRVSRRPQPPPVRWGKMRSLEMHAYRRNLRAFDKWDTRVSNLTDNARRLQSTLDKLAAPNPKTGTKAKKNHTVLPHNKRPIRASRIMTSK